MSFKYSYHIIAALVFISLGVSGKSHAGPMRHVSENNLHVSRYVESTPGPTEAQFNPLHVVIPRIRFGNNIHSVGQAINYLLIDTGYRLSRIHPDIRVEQILKLRLPDIQRNMGPLTLEQALKTLVSEPWILSVDPVHRLVSYELPDHYRQASTPRKPRKVLQGRPNTRKQVRRKTPRKRRVKTTIKKPAVRTRIQKARRHKPTITKYKWEDIEAALFGDDS